MKDIIATLNLPQKPANKGTPAKDRRKLVSVIAMKGEFLYKPFKSFTTKSLSTFGNEFRQIKRPTLEKI